MIWIIIFIKFFDIATTIIGVKFLKNVELNPIGYDVAMIGSITYLFLLFIFAKYYNKCKPIYQSLKSRNRYKILINTLQLIIYFYFIVIINNYMMIIHYLIR